MKIEKTEAVQRVLVRKDLLTKYEVVVVDDTAITVLSLLAFTQTPSRAKNGPDDALFFKKGIRTKRHVERNSHLCS